MSNWVCNCEARFRTASQSFSCNAYLFCRMTVSIEAIFSRAALSVPSAISMPRWQCLSSSVDNSLKRDATCRIKSSKTSFSFLWRSCSSPTSSSLRERTPSASACSRPLSSSSSLVCPATPSSSAFAAFFSVLTLWPAWAGPRMHSEQIVPSWQSKQQYSAFSRCSLQCSPRVSRGRRGTGGSGWRSGDGRGDDGGRLAREVRHWTVSPSSRVSTKQISHCSDSLWATAKSSVAQSRQRLWEHSSRSMSSGSFEQIAQQSLEFVFIQSCQQFKLKLVAMGIIFTRGIHAFTFTFTSR